jgi:hypothetical protein
MTGSTVRIGLVGYGMGGRYFHAPLIAAAAGCELAGVVTRSPERRAELAQDAPGVPAYDSLADLAAAGVDAVVVSTSLPPISPWSAKPSDWDCRWCATSRSPRMRWRRGQR